MKVEISSKLGNTKPNSSESGKTEELLKVVNELADAEAQSMNANENKMGKFVSFNAYADMVGDEQIEKANGSRAWGSESVDIEVARLDSTSPREVSKDTDKVFQAAD